MSGDSSNTDKCFFESDYRPGVCMSIGIGGDHALCEEENCYYKQLKTIIAERDRYKTALEEVNNAMPSIRYASQVYFYGLWDRVKKALEGNK